MIVVFGSINMDMVMPVSHFPAPGETVMGTGYEMTPGGKGANQALAACRTGAKTFLIGKVGDDGMGMRILNGLRRDGVITSGVGRSELPTGIAIIMLGPGGENEVIVAPGANMETTADQVPDSVIGSETTLLLQAETPAQEIWTLIDRAKKSGATTILNLAPVIAVPESILDSLDYLIVNRIEAGQLTEKMNVGMHNDGLGLARALAAKGKSLTCIVTMGAEGSVAVTPDGEAIHVPSLQLTAESVVDTTGAGDAYCGTLAGLLQEGKSLAEAMRMASVAGSLACLKKGSQESYAYLGDIQENLPRLGEAVIRKL